MFTNSNYLSAMHIIDDVFIIQLTTITNKIKARKIFDTDIFNGIVFEYFFWNRNTLIKLMLFVCFYKKRNGNLLSIM